MASVYRVQHASLGTEHVLKVLSVEGKTIERRLQLEGDIQTRLRHRNVVQVTDIIAIDDSPVLVMELVDGPSLADVLDEGPLREEQVRALAPGILAGVAAAHGAGVVHRDLKPANILLSLRSGSVVPKVADFGLVKVVDGDPALAMTRTGATMGTPQYMAPEQIQNAKMVDPRADVFALGTILYELLVGEAAFRGATHYKVFQSVLEGRYEKLSERVPGVSPAIEAAIDGALAPLDERWPDIEALWAVWSESSGVALETAAASRVEVPKRFVERLERCSPELRTSAPEQTAPTLAAEVPALPRTVWPWVGVVLGGVLLLALAFGAGILVVGALTLAF